MLEYLTGDIGLVIDALSLGFLQNEKLGFKQPFSYHNMHTNHVGSCQNADSVLGGLGRDL